MRSVNLIPPEDRRGDRAPMRTGNLSYVLVGGLAMLLIAVVATAFTSKQISDRESEKQALQQELDQATARADSLSAFANFRAIQEARTATISSLAESRFDWERVIRELSLVLPTDIWLTNLTGTVSSEVSLENGAEVALRDSVEGPALEMVGCAPSEDSVAGLMAALEDIDGVTRVGNRGDPAERDSGAGQLPRPPTAPPARPPTTAAITTGSPSSRSSSPSTPYRPPEPRPPLPRSPPLSHPGGRPGCQRHPDRSAAGRLR